MKKLSMLFALICTFIAGNVSAGGLETGTYVWEPATGLLLVRVMTDANQSCGFSNPKNNVPLRVFVKGNGMQVLEQDSGNTLLEFSLTRIAG